MDNQKSLEKYVAIKLGQEEYAVHIQYVQNIVRMMNITRVPKAPLYIKGIINLRGEIIPVISLRLKFGFKEDVYTNHTRIIILKLDGNAIGIIVDEVKKVIELSDQDTEKFVDAKDEKSTYIQGVGKVSGEIVTLLNIQGLINSN